MATLPTYEYAGAQYADLPRISTAPQQAAAQGFNVLSQQLDRMSAFFTDQATKDAQTAALKYAVEFPPSKEQLETAKRTGTPPVVQGSGRVFQETYNKASAHLLGSDILSNFQNRQSDRLSRIESGAPVDPVRLQKELRDDIDGSVSLLTNLDPETSIRFRAQMTTVGHTVYAQALKFDEKARQAAYQVQMKQSIDKLPKMLETMIDTYSKVPLGWEEGTASAQDIDGILQTTIAPFLSKQSIVLAGGNQLAMEAIKAVENAKSNAIVGKLNDRDFAPTAGMAFKKFMAGDVGELTSLYKSMSKDQQVAIRTDMIKSYADQEQTRKIDEAIIKSENNDKGNVLKLEFLSAGGGRKKEIISSLVTMGELTIQSAQELLKPKDPVANPMLAMSLYDQIKRGVINSWDQIAPYSNSMSRSEFESISRAVVDDQGRKAHERIDREAGITSPYIDPGKAKAELKIEVTKLYLEELQKKEPNSEGVPVYKSPDKAVEDAIRRYNGDKQVIDKKKKRDEAEAQVDAVMKTVPNSKLPDMPIDQIDFDKVKGLSKGEVDLLKKAQKKYTDNIQKQ